jgi:MFS family permease
MFGLVLVVGALIDRIGRRPALSIGLVVMAISCAGLLGVESVWATAVLLFGLGLGWNVSFVAATTELANSTEASERGKLLGFTDLVSGILAASLALIGGFALDSLGVAALAVGAAVLVALPIAPIIRRGARPTAVPETR